MRCTVTPQPGIHPPCVAWTTAIGRRGFCGGWPVCRPRLVCRATPPPPPEGVTTSPFAGLAELARPKPVYPRLVPPTPAALIPSLHHHELPPPHCRLPFSAAAVHRERFPPPPLLTSHQAAPGSAYSAYDAVDSKIRYTPVAPRPPRSTAWRRRAHGGVGRGAAGGRSAALSRRQGAQPGCARGGGWWGGPRRAHALRPPAAPDPATSTTPTQTARRHRPCVPPKGASRRAPRAGHRAGSRLPAPYRLPVYSAGRGDPSRPPQSGLAWRVPHHPRQTTSACARVLGRHPAFPLPRRSSLPPPSPPTLRRRALPLTVVAVVWLPPPPSP